MQNPRYLPDREMAYHYSAAMLFAQEMEVHLRAILHTIDYSFDDLSDTLSPDELRRFSSFERFLDKATIGSLKTKLRQSGLSMPPQAWSRWEQACTIRNELAHRYLEQLQLPPRDEKHREEIYSDLRNRVIILYEALMISRVVREKVEGLSEKQHRKLNAFLKELGVSPDEVNEGLWENRG